MLNLIIGRHKIKHADATGLSFKVRGVYVRAGRKFQYFQSRDSYPGVTRIGLIVKTLCGFKRLPRNFEIERGILEYLREYHAKGNMEFDCYAFASAVKGLPNHTREKLLQFWELKPFRKPQVGEVIFLADLRCHYFSHAAIYVGEGLYLSVYGAGGDLEVSSLHDMQAVFSVKTPHIATPKI